MRPACGAEVRACAASAHGSSAASGRARSSRLMALPVKGRRHDGAAGTARSHDTNAWAARQLPANIWATGMGHRGDGHLPFFWLRADRCFLTAVSRRDAEEQRERIRKMGDVNEVTREIVDAAYSVHSRLGPGLFESVYEAVLSQELERRGFTV